MIKIDLHGTYNLYYAILGMRNPMNSWHLMDSSEPDQAGNCTLGEKDLNLAQRLTLAGNEHGKFSGSLRSVLTSQLPLLVERV